MTEHLSTEELRWYTRHGLQQALLDWPSQRLQAFEDHVSVCDSCGQRLAEEAQEELALEELGQEMSREPRQLSSTWLCASVAVLLLLFAASIGQASSASTVHSTDERVAIPLDAGLLLADGDLPVDL